MSHLADLDLRARVDQLERELAHARAEDRDFAHIVSQLADPICQVDREGRFVYTNASFERWLGCSRLSLVGRTPFDAGVPKGNAERWAAAIGAVLDTGADYSYVDEFAGPNGPHIMQSRLSPHRAPSGEIDFVSVVLRDVTEQSRAATELETARNQLSAILDSMTESFLALDSEWRFSFVNRPVEELTRRKRDDLIGRNFWEVFPVLLGTEVQTEFERAMRERTASRFKFEYAPAGMAFEIHVQPSQDGITAYVIDSTEQVRAERELFEAHQTLSALINASPLPIIALTPEGLITVWNSAAERYFGWTAAEVMNKPLPFIPEEKKEEHAAMRARDLEGHGFTGHEIRRKRKDGSDVDMSVSTAPIRDASGAIRGIVSVYQDITERKRVESELREGERRIREREEAMRLATESARVGVWIYDTVHDRLRLTGTAAKILGFPDREMVTGVRQLLDRVNEADRARVRQEIKETLTRRDEYTSEYRINAGSGEVRWIAARGLAEMDASGHKVRFSGVVSDITDRKRVEEELAHQAAELARSNADLQQFAFVASHDLQEPLRTMTAYAQLLSRRAEDKLDEASLEYLGFIIDGASRMQRLINDLLAFSRILHGHERALEQVDLDPVVAWAIMNLNTAIKESGAVIEYENLPTVKGNQQELVQLVQNLLANAIKYRSSEPPHIRITTEEREGEVCVSVSDNGIGIDPQYHEHIFGVFKRLHGKDVPGTGIGLALCKRIVEKHGGRIWVESQPGHGATFRFVLPH